MNEEFDEQIVREILYYIRHGQNAVRIGWYVGRLIPRTSTVIIHYKGKEKRFSL